MGVVKATTVGEHVARYERLQSGNYFADFRRDKRLRPEVYHCIIQREGSTEILMWSQFHSLEHAQEFAAAHLQHLAGADSKPSKAR
jgi:hypothetical protein